MYKFAGLTPNQMYATLERLGYTGPKDESSMVNFAMTNAKAAAALGRVHQMGENAANRLNNPRGGPKKGFATGGAVGSTPQALDESQQNYAQSLTNPDDAENIANQEQELGLTQEAYNAVNVPSVGEAIGESINDPTSLTTKADVATITPTSDQLIESGTGQQTETHTATAANVPDPEKVSATTVKSAEKAEAADKTEANTYTSESTKAALDETLEGVEAATGQPTKAATVQGQYEELMKDFEDGTPPWASGAMRAAAGQMASRGMGASSMAGEAIVLAAMQAALPIATEDARTQAQFELQNLSNEQQMTIFKTQQRVAGLFNDQAQENAAKQFNADSQNQVDQFFAGLETTVSQFNAAQVNAIKQFNAEQTNIADRFNVEQQVTTDLFRAKQKDAINTFNAQLKQQRDQFNATNDLVIAQANTKWMQDVSTINTAAQNVANREEAAAANGLTSKAIDTIHQYERDMLAYSFQGSESAKERGLRFILGDMELDIAKERMDWQKDQAKGNALFEIAKMIW